MSEPKLISPMLDGFVMGDPISEHHGVRCCPAMVKESGAKYIVKIISIPASQVQLEALLLTGACSNESAALNYFKEQAQAVVEEVDTIRKLSKLEGFIPFEGCKIVPMENEVGYDVYLLGTYKRSLENYMRKHTMTHLAAINLGLDMCASLAVARQAGYLYVDLKPENIYISADQEYRIGDLGFIKLDSLKYASLPDKYRSAYTAPEIHDAYAQINMTVDVYAAGMILYQAYNGGILPKVIPGEPLVAPAFADYEMAEIILKACAPDPADRWADPIQMGQALVSYMQRNGANNDPIVPPVVQKPIEDPVEDSVVQETTNTQSPENDEVSNDEQVQMSLEDLLEGENEDNSTEKSLNNDDTKNTEDSSLEDETDDETLPDEETAANISYDDVSKDVEEILALADDLIDHEPPAPVIAPDPIEVTLPESVPEETTSEEVSEETSLQEISVEEVVDEYDEDNYEDDNEDKGEESSGFWKKVLIFLLSLIILAGLAFGGYYCYQHFYLQNIDALTLQGDAGLLTVQVDSKINEELLSVVCIDTHGTRQEKPVTDGKATFDGLSPNMIYNIQVEIQGLHKLTGHYSDTYTTPNQSNILNFVALTGNEEGSVMLSFNVDGADSSSWTVSYATDGEDVKSESFSGHIVNITGLTVGKNYTFILDSDDPLFLSGETQLSHTVGTPVFAQDLFITGMNNGVIAVNWKSPENKVTDNWIVHCVGENGYDQTITVSEPSATFQDIDSAVAHTIEVTAEGMGAGTRTYMTANAVTIKNASVKVKGSAEITVSWDAPEVDSQWVIVLSLDGYDDQQNLQTDKTKATIQSVIPGASYHISIQLADGTTVFGGNLTAKIPEAMRFNGKKLGLLAKNVNLDFNMCLRPEKDNWTRKDVKKDDYTTTFRAGEKAGFVVYVPSKYSTDDVSISILYLIRDEAGNMIQYDSVISLWGEMWKSRYCELDVPTLPELPGKYTMEIYLNGGIAHTQEFEIIAE